MKLQAVSSRNYSTNFNGRKNFKNIQTSKPEKTKGKEYDTIKSLALFGAAVAAAMSISGCSPKYQDKIPSEPVPAPIEEWIICNDDDDCFDTNITGDHSDTRSVEEKYDIIEKSVQEAVDGLEYLHNEVWDSFPEMYQITKDTDGNVTSYIQPDENSRIKEYDYDLDYKNYYSDNIIAQIASGEAKPWENIKNEKEAVRLIKNLLNCAQNEGQSSKNEIDSNKNINKGEYEVIIDVLNRLKENPDTEKIAKAYLEEIENAAIATSKKQERHFTNYQINELGYKDTSNEDKLAEPEDSDEDGEKLIDNIGRIELQREKIKQAKEMYESAKESFLEISSPTTEDIRNVQWCFENYAEKCRQMLDIEADVFAGYENIDPSLAIYSKLAEKINDNVEARFSGSEEG